MISFKSSLISNFAYAVGTPSAFFYSMKIVMTHPKNISINDYDYPLPEERIANYPVEPRDLSRLMVTYGAKGVIESTSFRNIVDYLPSDGLLVVNETKVVRARLVFYRETGARVEIFCLNAIDPVEITSSFDSRGRCVWKAFVGNAKRWKETYLTMSGTVNGEAITLKARQCGDAGEARLVEFTWEPRSYSFAEVLESMGRVPLPPYIHRDAEEGDSVKYQTIFARQDGSVAAPTAGLHFSSDVLNRLTNKGYDTLRLILHVGAGTFKPVTAESMQDHTMHSEKVIITSEKVSFLLENLHRPRIVVGTTSVRSLESLYWFGVKILQEGLQANFVIDQWYPYSGAGDNISIVESLLAVKEWLSVENRSHIEGETQLLIAPGYQFKLTDILVTNFHQPKSTLLLLVAAFSGQIWRETYRKALEEQFRFLSYGDACLFFPC